MTKKVVLFMTLIALSINCGKKSNTPDPSRFYYNFTTGKCVNGEGKEGYNPIDTVQAQETRNCECMDLSNHDLYWLLKGANLAHSKSYSKLQDYNFRGAKMDSSSLLFNSIIEADLRGAKMKYLAYGYAKITGLIDQYTELPPAGCQLPTNKDSIVCNR